MITNTLAATLTPRDSKLQEPPVTHPSIQSLGLLVLPSTHLESTFNVQYFDAEDASEFGLSAFEINQYQELAQLQSMICHDLAEGVSVLDACNIHAMVERGRVALDEIQTQNKLINKYLELLQLRLKIIEWWMHTFAQLNHSELEKAADENGFVQYLGLGAELFRKLRETVFPAQQDIEEQSTISLADIYCKLATYYVEFEKEFSEAFQGYLHLKQQASRLQFYLMGLSLLSSRAQQLADGMESVKEDLSPEQTLISEDAGMRLELARRLKKIVSMPVADLIELL